VGAKLKKSVHLLFILSFNMATKYVFVTGGVASSLGKAQSLLLLPNCYKPEACELLYKSLILILT
jgi:hypothetical protein